MPYLEWSNEFSIGVPVFDDEHRQLVDAANALHEAIAAGMDATALRLIEDGLFEHVAIHFAHEEMFFEDYPFAEEHAEQHRILLQRVAAYREATAPSLEQCAGMLDFLSTALVRHIAHCDMKLGRHLCATGQIVTAGPSDETYSDLRALNAADKVPSSR
jgi:hemerythrin